MKIYTHEEAAGDLEGVLESARQGDVVIRTDRGDEFSIVLRPSLKSPLDVEPIRTRATTEDILISLREFRERS